MEPKDLQPIDPDLSVLSDLVAGIADRMVSFLMKSTDINSPASTSTPTAAACNTTSGRPRQLQNTLRSLPPSGSEGVVHMLCTDGFNYIFGSVEMFCNAGIPNCLRPSLGEVPPHWVQASVTPLLPLAGELLLIVTVAAVLTVVLLVCSPIVPWLFLRRVMFSRAPFGGSDVILLSSEGMFVTLLPVLLSKKKKLHVDGRVPPTVVGRVQLRPIFCDIVGECFYSIKMLGKVCELPGPKPNISALSLSDAMSHSMATQSFPSQQVEKEADAEAETNPELYEHFANLVSSLPSSDGMSRLPLHRHEQGWYLHKMAMVGAMVADACFAARPSDILVATAPKAGTTWLKALLYATVHRREHPADAADHPFNSLGPHECVKFLEMQLFTGDRIPNLDKLPDPRLFSTHLPFVALPKSVVSSGRKIVYVCREPKDNLISMWQMANKAKAKHGVEPMPIEAAVEFFCDGLMPFGPYWDHVLGYWRAHLAHPDRVLFFKYEEIQRDPAAHVRKLAEFVGCPFGGAEDDDAVDAIVRICSFDHLSGLEVTKRGETNLGAVGHVDNTTFFRRGGVGDWANHISPEMARRIDAITAAKFKDSGLSV